MPLSPALLRRRRQGAVGWSPVNLVTNGTFDTDVSNWTHTNGGTLTWDASGAADLFKAVGDSSQMYQKLPGVLFIPLATYQFDYATISGTGTSYVGSVGPGTNNILNYGVTGRTWVVPDLDPATFDYWINFRSSVNNQSVLLDNIEVYRIA